jgi:hypothetical protein
LLKDEMRPRRWTIRDAIREYLSVVEEQLQGADVREIDVAI